MTEAEWVICTEPKPMLEFLRDQVSDRKLRLFAVACCRHIWNELQEESRHAVAIAEQFADGLVGWKQLQLANRISKESREPGPWDGAMACAFCATTKSAWNAAEAAARASQVAFDRAWDTACRKANRTHDRVDRESVGSAPKRFMELACTAQAALLHDIFGNPFRTAVLALGRPTAEIVALTKTIYDGRIFDRLPALADALEEVGCQETNILNHCRQPGPHVRGCWVLDLVLGKV